MLCRELSPEWHSSWYRRVIHLYRGAFALLLDKKLEGRGLIAFGSKQGLGSVAYFGVTNSNPSQIP